MNLNKLIFGGPADLGARNLSNLDEFRARLYCGHYGIFSGSRSEHSCMSSSRGRIRLTPYEERCLVETILATGQGDWKFDRFTGKHNPSGLEIWLANGRWFCSVWDPQRISLRTRSQRLVYSKLRRIRDERRREQRRNAREQHRIRHRSGVSVEALELIRSVSPAREAFACKTQLVERHLLELEPSSTRQLSHEGARSTA